MSNTAQNEPKTFLRVLESDIPTLPNDSMVEVKMEGNVAKIVGEPIKFPKTLKLTETHFAPKTESKE